GERGADPRELEDGHERQMRDRRDVAENDPEHEEVGGGAGLGGVAVGPSPLPLPPLAHLREVGVRVVAEIEEAHEDLAVGLRQVAIQIRKSRDDRERQPGEQRDGPKEKGLPPRYGGRVGEGTILYL